MKSHGANPERARGVFSPAFLLAQVGAHAAAQFDERLGPLGLSPAHAGLLRVVSLNAGASQQEVSAKLGTFPSRLVALVDDLQERGLVERHANLDDRRTYALQLTAEGRQTLEAVGRVAREHQDALLAALNKKERGLLASLLQRVANQQGLQPGVHPGFARIGDARGRRSKRTRIAREY